MHFTDLTPGWTDVDTGFERTLQIFTVKLAEIKGGIDWPLDVYGVIAARDDVDHNRNLLFSYSRMDSQELDQDVRHIYATTLIFLLLLYSFSLLRSGVMILGTNETPSLAGSFFALDWPVPCHFVHGSCLF